MTQETPIKLYDFVDPADGECVRREIQQMMAGFFPEFDKALLIKTFEDLEKLFWGRYPGYRASNTKYHDYEHTCSVVLANARLIYGAMIEGMKFDEKDVLKGLMAALFHDVGLIQGEDDIEGTGAKYTVGHEERSIEFMRANLKETFSEEDLEDITACIRCTILAMSPTKVQFRTESMRMMGYFLGSADLLAQIADRYYLEKLLLLFEEFQEAGLPGYATALELLQKTSTFYTAVARKRMDKDLEQVDRYMLSYFKARWDTEHDLYAEAITNNLEYLDRVLEECGEDLECFINRMRRGDMSVEMSS